MPATALSRSQVPLALAPRPAAREVTLAEFLLVMGDTRLPASVALYVIGSIARAVSDEHDAGRVHGRLDPTEVMLDSSGTVRIHPARPGARFVPAYAAPELTADGKPDVLCDVYSIGAIAYELLTGRLVPNGVAQPPSAFNPGVDPTVDELVLAAIDRDADQRPYTARALMSGVAHAFRELELEPDPAELGRLVAVVSPEPEMRRATGSVKLPGRPLPSKPSLRPVPSPKPEDTVDDDEADARIDTDDLRAVAVRSSKTPWLVAAVLIIAASVALWAFTRGGTTHEVIAAEPDVPAAVAPSAPAKSAPVKVKKIVPPGSLASAKKPGAR